MQTKTTDLPKGKIKKYFHLAKSDPIRAYLDLVNLFLVVTVIGTLVSILLWTTSVFKGDSSISFIAFNIGGFQVYWYGICLVLGTLGGILYVVGRNRNEGILKEHLSAVIFWAILVGIIGGRIVFIALDWQYYSQNIHEVFRLWNGGMSFYGSLAFGFIAIAAYSAIKNVKLGKVLDLFAPALLIGQFIGRWGSFFNQEYYGRPTEYFLKTYISPANRTWDLKLYSYFHPLFLYESVLCLIAFFVILKLRKKISQSEGMLFAFTILFYAIIRFSLGFLGVEEQLIWGLGITQVVSAIFAIVSLLIIFLLRGKEKKK